MFGPDLPAAVFTRFYNSAGSASRVAYESMTDAIRRCQETGATHDRTDPNLLGAILWPALHGQVLLRLDRPDFPRPPLDDVITETVRRVIGLSRESIGTSDGSTPTPEQLVPRSPRAPGSLDR
jgi:hypothetical protein